MSPSKAHIIFIALLDLSCGSALPGKADFAEYSHVLPLAELVPREGRPVLGWFEVPSDRSLRLSCESAKAFCSADRWENEALTWSDLAQVNKALPLPFTFHSVRLLLLSCFYPSARTSLASPSRDLDVFQKSRPSLLLSVRTVQGSALKFDRWRPSDRASRFPRINKQETGTMRRNK